MLEHDARACARAWPEQAAQAYATNGRTDVLTQKNSPNAEISPYASRAGGAEEFFTYVVTWLDLEVIKAGYSANPKRWERFARLENGHVHLVAAFPTEALARAYEATILAILQRNGVPAFQNATHATQHLGVSNGWTECYWLPDFTTVYYLPLPPLGRFVVAPRWLTDYADSDRTHAALRAESERLLGIDKYLPSDPFERTPKLSVSGSSAVGAK